MEPTIYKPSIYKGAGVYKDGGAGGYNGEFIYLNNFDNINSGVAISDIGDSIPIDLELYSIVNSNVFINKNCLVMNKYIANSHYFLTYVDFPNEYTIETYFSNFTGTYANPGTTEFIHRGSGIETRTPNDSYRHQCTVLDNDITLYNGAVLVAEAGVMKYATLPITYNSNVHYACVVKNGYSYIFVNGTLYIKYKNTNELNKYISFGREIYPIYIGINFICVRKGDYSNNLTSFTVPTSKYLFDG